jgi:3-phenylpropionate/cinnamic acid dioxygenase small subunit
MADVHSDREQISDVLIRYATGIDTRNWPLFRTCFTPDVHADYGHIGVWYDVDGITEFMTTAHRDMSGTKHMMSNFVIDVNGDEASAVSYVHAVLVLTDEPLSWVDAVGHYVDQFVRTPDGWRIRERKAYLTRSLTSDQAHI